MKSIRLIVLAAAISLISQASFAGACDTNATSLGRNLTNKCSSKTTKATCESCADAEFNRLVVKIETCRDDLQEKTNAFKNETCAPKP